MSDESRWTFERVKFAIGIALFVGLVVVHVAFKELPVYILGLPAVLWGVDLSSLLPGGKK